uniref:Uncharacterized protein n=1 Tax=Hucho hucho TaxID=62062 RepID=A0A4W5PD12_9TELE
MGITLKQINLLKSVVLFTETSFVLASYSFYSRLSARCADETLDEFGCLSTDTAAEVIEVEGPSLCEMQSGFSFYKAADQRKLAGGIGHFLLEPLLFKLLFSVDAALINFPMILCGLLDGHLCSLPLRLPGRPGLRIGELHRLEQSITFILTLTNGGPQCLVAVGQQGRVVLVRTCEGRSKVASFTEGCVSRPVVCVCARAGRKGLYYSTGSDILALDLPGECEAAPSLVVGHCERQDQGQAMERPREYAALQSCQPECLQGFTLAGPLTQRLRHSAAGGVVSQREAPAVEVTVGDTNLKEVKEAVEVQCFFMAAVCGLHIR